MSLEQRRELIANLFPSGIPKLWCPILSYFEAKYRFDPARIEIHLQNLSPHVKGILVPGSTGEGWEMRDADVLDLLKIVLPVAESLGMRVLIGVLKTRTDDVFEALDVLDKYLDHPAAVGITICPLKGKDVCQEELEAEVSAALRRSIPTAVYQLPQVTQNELAPETVARLAAAFPNFIMFKDTSGKDRVAKSGCDLQGVWMMRGSESNGYSKWLRAAGGSYDGYLLSTANVFAPELAEIILLVESGQKKAARELSKRIVGIVSGAFKLVANFKHGNPFTNANKLMDNLRTYGHLFSDQPMPLLYSGKRLPMSLRKRLDKLFPELAEDVDLLGRPLPQRIRGG